MALQRARHLRHLHERHETLLHARAARRGEHHHGQTLVGRALHEPRHLLAHDRAHRAHEELRLHDADGHAQARDTSDAGAHALLQARLLALSLELAQVAGELERVGFGNRAVPFHEAVRIQQVVDALARRHAQVTAASGAHVMAGGQAGAVELEAAMRARAPRIAVDSGFVGSAQHPAQKRRVIAERAEHPHAASRRASEKAVHLGQRQRLVAQQNHRSPAGVDGRQHGMAVAEQCVGVLLAQAHRALGELDMAIAPMILRVHCAGGETRVAHGLHQALRGFRARHDERDGLGARIDPPGAFRRARGGGGQRPRHGGVVGRVGSIVRVRRYGKRSGGLLGHARKAVGHVGRFADRLGRLARLALGQHRSVGSDGDVVLLGTLHRTASRSFKLPLSPARTSASPTRTPRRRRSPPPLRRTDATRTSRCALSA